VIAFDPDPDRAGSGGGIDHFGFRLVRPKDLDGVLAQCIAAGGTLIERGEFAAGMPFAYVRDPDGYTLEIWYEPGT
jgi:catechol 2,3-dioxygenase-like lactoylglutathione lyase family enzyme